MDKWFQDILPDKDPYHNRGRDQMRKKGGPEFECLWGKSRDLFLLLYRGITQRQRKGGRSKCTPNIWLSPLIEVKGILVFYTGTLILKF